MYFLFFAACRAVYEYNTEYINTYFVSATCLWRVQVEEVLKARSLTVAKQAGFSRPPALGGGRGTGGRGGRGRGAAAGGRGGRGRVSTAPAHSSSTNIDPSREADSAPAENVQPEDGVEYKSTSPRPAASPAIPSTPQTPPCQPQQAISEPKTPPRSDGKPEEASFPLACTPQDASPPDAPPTPSSVDSSISAITGTTRTSLSPVLPSGRRLSTHRHSGGRLSGGSARRKSSIAVSGSVLASLGLSDVDDVSLDGVLMFMWDGGHVMVIDAVSLSVLLLLLLLLV